MIEIELYCDLIQHVFIGAIKQVCRGGKLRGLMKRNRDKGQKWGGCSASLLRFQVWDQVPAGGLGALALGR